MGIRVTRLLESNVFIYQFDFQEWPAVHQNENCIIMPYNGTIFTLRKFYNELFGTISKETEDQKMFRIIYKLNILPSIANRSNLVEVCGDTEELEIFDTQSMMDLLGFKWKAYSRFIHSIGFVSHICYLFVFSLFVFSEYVYKSQYGYLKEALQIMNFFCLIYPFVYDMTQLALQGLSEYMTDPWNYFD